MIEGGIFLLCTTYAIILPPSPFLFNMHSSRLISSHNKVYQSLALLVRWADHVLLHGIQSDAPKPHLEVPAFSSSSSSPVLPSVSSLEEVAALVQDAVNDLVQIAVEKLKEGDSIYGNNGKKHRQTSSSNSGSSSSSSGKSAGGNERNGRYEAMRE